MTDREIMKALLVGKRIRSKEWPEGRFIRLDKKGTLRTEQGDSAEFGVFDCMLTEDVEVAPCP